MATHSPVPLCDLGPQYAEFKAQFEVAVSRVLASGQVINGPDVAALEDEVAQYCQASHGVGCGSGTEALSLALHGLEIGPGDEVIVPNFTFFASAGCIARTGAKPVFVDIEPDTFNLDPVQVGNKITSRTRAIMVVHLFGQCAEMSRIWQIAERAKVPIIEDAAQAMGAEYQDKRAGSLGIAGCLSFYPTKNLGAYGDAGLTVTSDANLAARMTVLRTHGMTPKYYHKYLGWNARLDTIQAALLRIKLPHLDRWISQRQEAARRYDELIEDRHLSHFLKRPTAKPQRRHTWNQYVVRVGDGRRDDLAKYLKSNGVGFEIYYPMPLHLQECLSYLGHKEGEFPVSEAACKCVLALPMYPDIKEEQQARVIDVMAEYVRGRGRLAA
jgi:dTDP-4-amino-4,6-dideoxygalactose transaminase